MKKIIYYYLNFRPTGNGRIIFRLEGENQNRLADLSAIEFAAVAAVLAQKRITYDISSGTFISYDDENVPLTDQNLLV